MFEDAPRPKPPEEFIPAKLDGWSAEALRDYMAALREEIARAEAALEAREAQKRAADSFFKTG